MITPPSILRLQSMADAYLVSDTIADLLGLSPHVFYNIELVLISD